MRRLSLLLFLLSVSCGGDDNWSDSPAGNGSDGTPIELAESLSNPSDIAADASHVYWVSLGEGIGRVAISTKEKATIISSGEISHQVMLYDSHVYWSSESGEVRRSSKGSNTRETLHDGFGLGTAWGLWVDDSGVYWTTETRGDVMRMSHDGSAPATVATGMSYPRGIGADDTDVYWTDADGGAVYRAPITGGGAIAVASGQDTPVYLVLSDTHVYWANLSFEGTASAIMRASKSGGGAEVWVDDVHARDIAVDSSHFYWITDEVLSRKPLAGGAAETLVSGESGLRGLAVNDTAIFILSGDSGDVFSPNGDGRILMLTK